MSFGGAERWCVLTNVKKETNFLFHHWFSLLNALILLPPPEPLRRFFL